MVSKMDERLSKFKANLNFFCNWEEISGRPWKEFNPASERDCRLAVYCGLKDEIEEITLVECGRMIDTETAPESWDFIFKQITKGVGGKNQEGGDGSKNGRSESLPLG